MKSNKKESEWDEDDDIVIDGGGSGGCSRHNSSKPSFFFILYFLLFSSIYPYRAPSGSYWILITNQYNVEHIGREGSEANNNKRKCVGVEKNKVGEEKILNFNALSFYYHHHHFKTKKRRKPNRPKHKKKLFSAQLLSTMLTEIETSSNNIHVNLLFVMKPYKLRQQRWTTQWWWICGKKTLH